MLSSGMATAEVACTGPAQDWPCQQPAVYDGQAHGTPPYSTQLLEADEFGRWWGRSPYLQMCAH